MTSANRHQQVYTLYHHIKHTSIQHMASANIHMYIPYSIKHDIGIQHMMSKIHSIHHMTETHITSANTHMSIYMCHFSKHTLYVLQHVIKVQPRCALSNKAELSLINHT